MFHDLRVPFAARVKKQLRNNPIWILCPYGQGQSHVADHSMCYNGLPLIGFGLKINKFFHGQQLWVALDFIRPLREPRADE